VERVLYVPFLAFRTIFRGILSPVMILVRKKLDGGLIYTEKSASWIQCN
jgi:hypothetical protein